MKKRFFAGLGFFLLTLLLHAQLTQWKNVSFGVFFFLFSFFLLGRIWKSVYSRFLPDEEPLIHKMLGFFTPVLLIGFLVGIFLALYKINPFVLSLCFFATALLSLEFFFQTKNKNLQDILDVRNIEFGLSQPPGVLPGVYFFFWIITFAVVLQPATQVLNSPWQHIPVGFLILFFLLTCILLYLLRTSKKTGQLLFLLVLHSILLHSYLPFSHVNPWGGDVWRMIAVEEKFLEEKPLLPVLFGDEVKWREAGPIKLPEALVIPNKYIYSHLWGETVFLASVLHIDLVTLNRFLLPVLWSLLIPILCFALGKKLFDSEKKGLIFAFLTFLPFSLQALGGLTLAVSLGTLMFLFLLYLWIEYIQTEDITARNLAFLFGVLSLFGYTLYFLLFWFVVAISLLYKNISKEKIRRAVWFPVTVLSILFFPLLELISKIDHLPMQFSFVGSIKQFVGEWSGWYIASGIRQGDTLSGNIIFNHTPQVAFVDNIFTHFRWHLMLLMGVLGFFILYGLWSVWREKKLEWKIFTTLFFVVAGGYVIGWYFLEGERSFVRRLDPLLALLLLLFACYGLFTFFEKRKIQVKQMSVGLLAVICFFAFTITTVYATGPDMRVVSASEYDAARVIANQYKNNKNEPCVLADTWLLLALGGITKGNIVGGGFPIDTSFGQKERVELYSTLLKNPTPELTATLGQVSLAQNCFVVVPKKQKNIAKIKEIFGNPRYANKDLFVFGIGLKN